MAKRLEAGDILRTALITAFTIAVALIWKEVIVEAISVFLPNQTVLFSKFIAAVIATVVALLIIYLIIIAEYRAEGIFKRFKRNFRSYFN